MNPLDSSAQTSSLSCQSASQSVSIRPTAPPVQLSSDYLKHIIRYRSIDVLHQCISPLGFVYPFRTETLHPPKHREWMTSWWLTFCHFLISGVYAGVSACMRAFLRRQSCWTENQTPTHSGKRNCLGNGMWPLSGYCHNFGGSSARSSNSPCLNRERVSTMQRPSFQFQLGD